MNNYITIRPAPLPILDERPSAGLMPILIFILSLILVTSHLNAYGLTFDEARMILDAKCFIGWLHGNIPTYSVWFGTERPSPAKILVAFGLILGGDKIFWIRFFPAVLYAIAVTRVYSIVRRPRGKLAAYSVLLSLLVAPPLFAFSAQASNESVATSFILLSLSEILVARTHGNFLLAGLFAGLSIGTKISGAILLFAVPIWLWKGIQSELPFYVRLKLFMAGTFFGFLLTWPVLVIEPSALWSHITYFAGMMPSAETGEILIRPSTLYFGPCSAPQWHYIFVWFAIGFPPILLLFALYELIFRRGPLSNMLRSILLFAFITGILAHEFLREGMRHLMPVAAVMALLGGLGAGTIAERFPRYKLIAVTAIGLPFLISLLLFHPAESFYISELIGGPKTAVKWNMPVTASGDILTFRILSGLPNGDYAIVPGGSSDLPLYFDSPEWRLELNRLLNFAGKKINITSKRNADWFLILGSSSYNGKMFSGIGRPILTRSGIVYASILRNPLRASAENNAL